MQTAQAGWRRDLAATYVCQAYVSAVSVLTMPLQARLIGAEGFGLVGLMVALQAWFLLLDFGRMGFLTRESAHARSQGRLADLAQALRQQQRPVWLAAVLGALALMALSGALTRHWIKPQALPPAAVTHCLWLMALTMSCRLLAELYRGVLVGLGQLVGLAVFSALMATLRGVLVLPVLAGTPFNVQQTYFFYQLLIAALECLALMLWAWRAVRMGAQSPAPTPALEQAQAVPGTSRAFARHMGVVAALWVLVSQLDKLLLSGLLSLDGFGVLSLALVLASSVTLLAAPFGSLVPARLTALRSQQPALVLDFYRKASRAAAVLVGAVGMTLLVHAWPALRLWLGSPEQAAQTHGAFVCYVLGNMLLALNAFAYYLHFSSGDLRLHLQGTLWYCAALAPLLLGASWAWGPLGAGAAWLLVNALYLLLWLPRMHRAHAPNLHRQWLLQDLAPAWLGAGAGAWLMNGVPQPDTPWGWALWLAAAGVLALAGAGLAAGFWKMGTRPVAKGL